MLRICRHQNAKYADLLSTQEHKGSVFKFFNPETLRGFRIHVDDQPKRCKTCIYTQKRFHVDGPVASMMMTMAQTASSTQRMDCQQQQHTPPCSQHVALNPDVIHSTRFQRRDFLTWLYSHYSYFNVQQLVEVTESCCHRGHKHPKMPGVFFFF